MCTYKKEQGVSLDDGPQLDFRPGSLMLYMLQQADWDQGPLKKHVQCIARPHEICMSVRVL